MERIPFEQRLSMAEMQDPNLLKICKMALGDFLSALTAMIGEEAAARILREMDEYKASDHPFCAAIAVRVGVYEDSIEEFAYLLLVEAFSKIHDMKWGKSK